MPSPDPRRDLLLKYLRNDFPYQRNFEDWNKKTYDYTEVKDAVYSLKDNNPEINRILTYHLYTRLPRTRIAEEVGFDPSTVKRKLDQAADLVMQRLAHEDFPPRDLFTIKDMHTEALRKSPFPVTFQKNW